MSHIILNALLQRVKLARIARRRQLTHICLGEVLVGFADIFRGVNKTNVGFQSHRSEGALCQMQERARLPCTDIVQTRSRAALEEPITNIQHIFDINKIAALHTVGKVGAMRAKQFHAAGGFDLARCVENDRRHATFVVLVGTVNIEKFQSGPKRRRKGLLHGPDVEVIFGTPVRIQRLQLPHDVVVVAITVLAQPISSGAGSIDERDAVPGAQIPNCLRVMEIEAVKQGHVLFGGIGAGAEMKNSFHIGMATLQPVGQMVSVYSLNVAFPGEISVFIFPTKIVGDDEVAMPLVVQFAHHAAPDEARCACYDDHIFSYLFLMSPKATSRDHALAWYELVYSL